MSPKKTGKAGEAGEKKLPQGWYKPRQCFKKYYKGKTYYLEAGKGEPTREGQLKAWGEWEAKRAQIDAEEKATSGPYRTQYEAHLKDMQAAADWYGSHHNNTQRRFAKLARAEIEASERALEEGSSQPPNPPKMLADIWELDRDQGTKNFLAKQAEKNKKPTLEFAKQSFLAKKKADGNSVQRLYLLEQYTQTFIDFLHDENVTRVNDIDSIALDHFINTTKSKDLQPISVRDRLAAVKMLIKHAWKLELIKQLPRNIDDLSGIKVHRAGHKLEIFAIDDVRKLAAASSTRTKAFILLGLNCGYTQSDIAHLDAKSLDLTAGIIDTERHKTKEYGIRQRHKLWPVTVKTLKLCLKNGEANIKDLLFTDSKGESLLKERMEYGKFKRSDAVKNSFYRVLKKTKIKGSFKQLRKTGASLLETKILDAKEKHLTSVYLAHAEQGTKRHYTEQDYEALDKPLAELGELLGIK